MKSKSLRLLTLPLLFAMCGCSDIETGTYFMCITKKTGTSISKEYEKFTGESTFKREFKNDTTISLVTTTKSGNLVVKITNTDSNEEHYTGNLTEDFSCTVYVPSGNYSLFVEGKEHSGSYEFSWKDTPKQ